jgi:peptide/nickel transport system ATP-binding protein
MGADAAEAVLTVRDLEVWYKSEEGDVVAVNRASLSIRRGACVGLAGESGCGKSTIAMAIMGHLGKAGRMTAGSIRFLGREMTELSAAEFRAVRGAKIAMIYQDAGSALNPAKTVGAQLSEVLRVHGEKSRRTIHGRMAEMLSAVGFGDASAVLGRFPHQLSGGQQQRVVIAMAFLADPELLVLDEPTTALDVTVEAEIMELLTRMRKRHGTAMLFISHNLGLLRHACDEIAIMYAGEIVEQGTPAQILDDPCHPYSRGLLACLPRLNIGRDRQVLQSIPGQVPRLSARPEHCAFRERCRDARRGICDLPQELIDAGRGRLVRCGRWTEVTKPVAPAPSGHATSERQSQGASLVELRGVEKLYEATDIFGARRKNARPVQAARDVSIVMALGETLAVVGESGSGKSTLAKIIAGLEPPTGGHVAVLGSDVTGISVEGRSSVHRRAVQMIFQNPDSTLNPAHSIGFILARAVRRLGGAGGSGVDSEVDRLLDLVRLPRVIKSMTAHQLSGGQKQRVAVARAFAGSPALVIADEPTSALDTSVKIAILDLLRGVQRRTGAGLIFISHDLAVVRYIADRVAVMYRGEVVEIGTCDDIFAPPYHPYTEALLAAIPRIEGAPVRHPARTAAAMEADLDLGGCVFAARCGRRLPGDRCHRVRPPQQHAGNGHIIRCHIAVTDLRAAPSAFTVAASRSELDQ